MTTDLSNKIVEQMSIFELLQNCGSSRPAAELARRLEEAQQKIVAQQARISDLLEALEVWRTDWWDY